MTQRATPMPYQKEGVRLIGQQFKGRALLADEMGLGKTLQALWFYARNLHKTAPAVVVCPAVVKYNWEREAAVHVGIRAHVAEGRRCPGFGLGLHPQLTIINYDILGGWLPYLKKLRPKLLIFDEPQYLTNPKTQRCKAGTELARGVPYVLGLSGTPLNNRPIELWPFLHILRPDIYGSRTKFGYAYCKPTLDATGKIEFKGSHNREGLYKSLKENVMIRRLKADVLEHLPPKMRSVVPLELHDPDGEYKEASTDFLGWVRKNHGAHRANRAARNLALTRMGYLIRLAAKRKVRAAVAWIDDKLATTDEKIVLFCHHTKMVEALEKRYAGQCVRIDGSVTAKRRQLAVDAFQNSKKCRVFIGNDAARVGITLTAATILAFIELYWRPSDHTQAEDRIHRITQNKSTMFYYLVAHGTVEEYLCELVQEKQKVISAILDGKVLEDDLDIFDQLVKRMMETSYGTAA